MLNYHKNKTIFKVDDSCTYLYKIKHGFVGIYNTKDLLINVLAKDDIIGGYESKYNKNFINSVKAITPVQICQIDINKYSNINLIEDLKNESESLLELINIRDNNNSSYQKTIKSLLWLMKKYHKYEYNPLVIPFSAKIISEVSNNNYQTTTRHLSKLNTLNIINTEYSSKYINNIDRLERLI